MHQLVDPLHLNRWLLVDSEGIINGSFPGWSEGALDGFKSPIPDAHNNTRVLIAGTVKTEMWK